MALKLPKSFHPDFSRPGVKPTGAVEVDWSNPLARGLQAFWKLQDLRDLVGTRHGTLYGDGYIDVARGYIGDGTQDTMVVGQKPVHSGDITILAAVKFNSVAGTQSIFTADSYNNGKREYQFRIHSGVINFIPFVSNSNGNVNGSTSLSANTRYVVAATHSSTLASNNCKVYLDGKLDGQGTKAGSLDADGANQSIGALVNTTNTSIFLATIIDSLNGCIEFVAAYNRALSASEIAALSRAPYQILKPAQPMMLFTSAGGGGGTYTVTGSLSAVLQKQGIARQATLNAILQKQGLTLNSSVDALLQKSVDITGEIDAILKKLGITSVSSIDALLQKRGSVSSSLDAILTALTAGETTASIDAILKKLGVTNAASLDSVLQKQGVNVSASLSALLQKAVSLSSVMDAILQKTVTTSASLDAILTAIGSGTLSANFDAILRKTLAVNLSIDALLQKKDLTVYASIDALLSKRQTTTAALDAILFGSASIAASLDALLKRTGVTITANLDAILALSGSFITPKNLIYVMAEDRIVTVLAEDRTVKVI